MWDFIFPYRGVIIVVVVLVFVGLIQSCASVVSQNHTIVVTDQRCLVDSAYNSAGTVVLAMKCGDRAARTARGDLVATYINDRTTTFTCDVRKSGEAVCSETDAK